MTTIGNMRGVQHASTLLILGLLWLAAPHASQEEGANEGFIFFTSDRHRPGGPQCPTAKTST